MKQWTLKYDFAYSKISSPHTSSIMLQTCNILLLEYLYFVLSTAVIISPWTIDNFSGILYTLSTFCALKYMQPTHYNCFSLFTNPAGWTSFLATMKACPWYLRPEEHYNVFIFRFQIWIERRSLKSGTRKKLSEKTPSLTLWNKFLA